MKIMISNRNFNSIRHRIGKASIMKHCFSGERERVDFGFNDVPTQDKENLVKEVFSKVANKYDVMNDFMSMGTHRLWKDDLVKMLGIQTAAFCEPDRLPRHLDVAGGTGDVAFRVANEFITSYHPLITSYKSKIQEEKENEDSEKEKPVVVCDINPEMLNVGRKRVKSILGDNEALVGFVEGNAENLPFPDASFDLYTVAFGLRNVTNKDKALSEAFRVLRKGGRMCILEFSTVNIPVLREIYDQYSFQVIPMLGRYVANDETSYQYLVESIRRFPPQEELLSMVESAGFSLCSYTNFTFGTVAVHSGYKL